MRAAWRKVSFSKHTSAFVLVAVAALCLACQHGGKEELITSIYSPLYSEVSANEESMRGNVMAQPIHREVFDSLQRNGRLARVPRRLRRQLVDLYQANGDMCAYAWSLTGLIQNEVAGAIMQLRTEEGDKAWARKAVAKLNKEQKEARNQAPPLRSTLRHAGRAPTRDKTNRLVTAPGGLAWQINDWMSFPESVQKIESIWSDSESLYFDDRLDMWYLRLTREDLRKRDMTLLDFLTPVHTTLAADGNFQKLVQRMPVILSQFQRAKEGLSERMRAPTRITDLLW